MQGIRQLSKIMKTVSTGVGNRVLSQEFGLIHHSRCFASATPPVELLQDARDSIILGEPLATPSSENNKVYAPHIEEIVSTISKLTLLEVADLNSLLKTTLNIADSPMMSYGAMPAAAPAEEDDSVNAPQEQCSFTVKLTGFEIPKKVAVIKEIKLIMEGMNLVQAKKFVESAPTVVKSDLTKVEAKELLLKLESVGATAVME